MGPVADEQQLTGPHATDDEAQTLPGSSVDGPVSDGATGDVISRRSALLTDGTGLAGLLIFGASTPGSAAPTENPDDIDSFDSAGCDADSNDVSSWLG